MEIRKAKIKYEDGTFSESIPIGANSDDIEMSNISGNLTEYTELVEEVLQSVKSKNRKQDDYLDLLNIKLIDLSTNVDKQNLINENQQKEIDGLKKNYKDNVYFVFNSVEEMKNAKLKDGDIAQTLGYYFSNDGGEALYKIKAKTDSMFIDGKFLIQLNNSFVAELIIKDNTVNIRQLGAKSLEKNNIKNDIHPFILSYITYLSKSNNRIKLYIPSGFWYCSETRIESINGFEIFGDYGFTAFSPNEKISGTIISSLNNNQNTIINLEKIEGNNSNFSIKNILFTTLDIIYDNEENKFKKSTIKNINEECLNIKNCYFAEFDNINFIYTRGRCLNIANSWEINFKLLFYRFCDNLLGELINFGQSETGNVSACNFEYIMFERCHGNLINCEAGCKLGNCHFGTINFEDAMLYDSGSENFTLFDDSNQDTEIISHSLLNVQSYGSCNVTIDNIILNNFCHYFFTKNNVNYAYNNIINVEGNGASFSSIINNIHIVGLFKNSNVIKSSGNINNTNSLFINNIMIINSIRELLFNVQNFAELQCNNISQGNNFISYQQNTDWIPFYGAVKKSSNQLGKLTYYHNARNKLKVVARLANENQYPDSFYIYSSSDNLKVRAIIPNGYTCVIKIKAGDFEGMVNLDGTGAWKNYDIPNLHTIINYPTAEGMAFQPITISKVSGPNNCYFDFYRFY